MFRFLFDLFDIIKWKKKYFNLIKSKKCVYILVLKYKIYKKDNEFFDKSAREYINNLFFF